MPSLKPIRLRGVAWAARSTTSGRSRAGTSGPRPGRSRSGPGCGWRARRPAGRRAQAWTHDVAAGLRAGSRSSPGNVGRSTSASGRFDPPGRSRLSNSDGPKPTVSVSRDGVQARAPRRCRPAAPRPSPPTAPYADRVPGPGSSARPRRVHSFSSSISSARFVGDHVERGEVQPVLGRGGDARPGARRGTATASTGRGRASAEPCDGVARPPSAAAPARGAGRDPGSGRAEQAAGGETARVVRGASVGVGLVRLCRRSLRAIDRRRSC